MNDKSKGNGLLKEGCAGISSVSDSDKKTPTAGKSQRMTKGHDQIKRGK